MKPEYIRTDRNGTKIYHDWTCPRCGGAGESDKWCFTGRICYECGGSGKAHKPTIIKEYTREYEEKLNARREAREAKRLAENPPPSVDELKARADEARRNTWVYQGFGSDGVGYIISGNTYAHRDAIKAAGGRWHGWLRVYVSPRPAVGLDGVQSVEVNAQDICNEYGYIDVELSEPYKQYIN